MRCVVRGVLLRADHFPHDTNDLSMAFFGDDCGLFDLAMVRSELLEDVGYYHAAGACGYLTTRERPLRQHLIEPACSVPSHHAPKEAVLE